MNDIILSYIIPVFNTDQWLGDFLSSILRHKGDDIEFIIVDDGSTDNSYEILKGHALKDNRILLIHQINGGLSKARNAGLKHAKGKYVLFVDSDDVIETSAVSQMVLEAIKYDADVVSGRIMCITSNNQSYPWGKFSHPSIYKDGFEFMQAMENECSYFPMVFGYIVNRTLLNNNSILFEDGLIHEDELWTPQVLARAGTCVSTAFYHYHYRTRRPGSIMSTIDPFDRCLSLARIIQLTILEIELVLTDKKNFRKAWPFYKKRLISFTTIIDSLYSKDESLKILKDFAFGHLNESYSIYMSNHE